MMVKKFDKYIRPRLLLRKSECHYFLSRKNIKANGFLVQIENVQVLQNVMSEVMKELNKVGKQWPNPFSLLKP